MSRQLRFVYKNFCPLNKSSVFIEMDMCLLCLEVCKDSEQHIKYESVQWLEWKVDKIIEKHMWPLQSLTSHSQLCTSCWQCLSDFHHFYERIEKAQNLFASTNLKMEIQEMFEDDELDGNIIEGNMAEAKPNQSYEDICIVKAIDTFLDDFNAKEKEIKLEGSNNKEPPLMVEEVTMPLKRSCRLRNGDPLKKPQTSTKIRKTSKRKIVHKGKQRKSTTKAKGTDEDELLLNETPATEDLLHNDSGSENHEDLNCNSDDTKLAHKSSLEHKEQDKFVSENFKIICGICQEPMPTFYDVSAHSAKEHNQRGFVKCCNKKFYRRIILVEHIRWHLDPERFKCKECGKILADRRCLQVHERLHEQQERNHICDICGKGFARPVTLQRHKYTHIPDEERTVPCNQCDKKFANKDLLMEHVRSVHLHSYSVVCDICGKEIRSKAVFQRHMLQHAGLQTTVSCDICGLKLSDKRRLKVHKQTQHSQEASKEYKCPICSKLSASRGALKQHVQYNHETGYDFKCTVCDKAFKRACTLREHMATHTGTVLYTCPYCPKTFNSNANMYTHRKKAHPQKWEEAFREKYSGNLPPKLQKASSTMAGE